MTDGLERREVLAAMAGGLAGSTALAAAPATARGAAQAVVPTTALPDGAADRAFMLALLEKMASPILGRMARGRLQQEWTPELSPTWDGRDPRVGYLEAFGRLIDGIAPWLAHCGAWSWRNCERAGGQPARPPPLHHAHTWCVAHTYVCRPAHGHRGHNHLRARTCVCVPRGRPR